MAELVWSGKHLSPPEPAELVTDAIVYPQGHGYPSAWPLNRLIWGDNLTVMAALLAEYEGQIDLIYVDPPFFTNRTFRARIGQGEDSRRPEEWKLAEGYPDRWEALDQYLQFLYERLAMMVRLLAPHGTLYVHLDWHANAYARLLLDELLGSDHLLNEIIWVYHGPSPIRSAFNRKHDTILAYVKGSKYTFNADAVREPYHPVTVKTFTSSPRAGFGKMPDLERGKVPEDWWYFPVVARLHSERTGYPTQKPQALLERIILASSNPGDLVADFFCGSGTTPLVAAQLGRRFLAVDSTLRAIHTTQKRLLSTQATFRLERTSAMPFPCSESAPCSVTRSAEGILVSGCSDLEYWEVDPDWDGNVFRSARQAIRPRRGGEMARELKIQTGRRVCVRLVSVEGERFQIEA